MSESERIILRKLVERLERELQTLSRDDRRKVDGYWEGEPPPVPDGLGHKVAALDWAKKALASGDDDEIRQAALHAPPLERTGKEMAAAFERKAKDEAAKALAERRGAGQAADAERRRATINELAAPHLAKGMTRQKVAGLIAESHPELGAEAQIRRLIVVKKGGNCADP